MIVCSSLLGCSKSAAPDAGLDASSSRVDGGGAVVACIHDDATSPLPPEAHCAEFASPLPSCPGGLGVPVDGCPPTGRVASCDLTTAIIYYYDPPYSPGGPLYDSLPGICDGQGGTFAEL